MRILWVKVGGLWPVNTGGRLRTFNIISELSRRNPVTVIGTHHPDDDAGELARHLPHCQKVISLPYANPKRSSLTFVFSLLRSWFSRMPVDIFKFRIAEVKRQVEAELATGNYDICIADFLVALPSVPAGGKVPVVYFSHNVEHMIWKRLCQNDSNVLRRLVLELEWRKMRAYEAAASERVDLTIAVSDEDAAQLQRMAPGSRISSVPTGVDVDFFRAGDPAAEDPLELVFTGSMDWHPNEDAILYFIDSILPRIRSKLPLVTLTVVGRNPSRQLQRLASEAGVRVTGTVDDIRPYVEQAAVYIVPLRIGGGTRLKIFEALAMGKAIVSTTIGAEGLPLEEGIHVVRADEPSVFAREVIALLGNEQRRRQLAQAGRQLVEDHYSWASVAAEFEARCREVLPAPRTPAGNQAATGSLKTPAH